MYSLIALFVKFERKYVYNNIIEIYYIIEKSILYYYIIEIYYIVFPFISFITEFFKKRLHRIVYSIFYYI